MRARGRWLAQQGVDTSAIMGDTCPTLSSNATPLQQERGPEFWTVSRWAARFVDSFPHLSLADRLACWSVIFVTFQVGPHSVKFAFNGVGCSDVAQWQINPSAETYYTIPEWYRPLPEQHFMPHMACLDILIWYATARLCTRSTILTSQAIGTHFPRRTPSRLRPRRHEHHLSLVAARRCRAVLHRHADRQAADQPSFCRVVFGYEQLVGLRHVYREYAAAAWQDEDPAGARSVGDALAMQG